MGNRKISGDELCRTCLQHSRQPMYSLAVSNVSIKGTGETEETLNLADIYIQCTQLLYEQTLGGWICQNCYDKLIEFFVFRKMCIDSYNELEQTGSSASMKVEPLHVVEEAEFEDFLEYSGDDDNTFDKEIILSKDNTPNETAEDGTQSKSSPVVDMKQESDGEMDFDDSSDSEADIEVTLNASPENKKSQKAKRQPKKRQTANASKSSAEKSESIFVCDKCPKKFFKKHRYDAHLRKHSGMKPWQCDHCDKTFNKYTTLKSHTAALHYEESAGAPVFTCDVDGCGKTYSQKESLRNHVIRIHVNDKPKPKSEKICEHCGKVFGSNAALVKHSYTHTKVTPYKCHVCAKMFASNYKLKEHVMRHDGIKNFVCPTCGLRKTTGHELRVHMKYHSNDIQFPCELCDLVFTRMANMKRHQRVVHCGIKAYPCPHCDKSFGKAETLKHHVMTHTGERPLACPTCDKRFIQPIALKTHMKVHNKS